jgi:hypothetical protein
MRTLLITNYWSPWNTPGTMRWLQLSKYIDFDVLTSRKPRGGIYDETLPASNATVFHYGYNLYAILSGLWLTFRAIFRKYDLYIFSSPPESFIIGAYILQRLGRRVILDMRDTIDRPFQKLKVMIPIYRFFYKRIKEKTVSFQFFDETAKVVRSGYTDILLLYKSYKKEWKFHKPTERLKYQYYRWNLANGLIQPFREKSRNYSSSSFINLLHLGFKGLPRFYHPEVHDQPVINWKESASQMKEIINKA